MTLAAIDIGSNAVRLLICEVVKKGKNTEFNKLNLLRIPVRLGFDVFEKGFIGGQKKKMLINTIKAFNNLMKVYEVDHYMACATSAMRDAENAKEIIKEIKSETSIEIEVITGELEAEIIYENHIAETLESKNAYMYIDVGGGSTEVSIFSNGALSFYKSFNIGTIRLLKGGVANEQWVEMRNSIKKFTKNKLGVISIGSGGNINKVFSMSKKKDGKPISLSFLKELHQELSMLTVKERIDKYNLREDRADVIVPALLIYINAMKWASSSDMLVPKIGLADGLIHHLWEEVAGNK